MKLYRIALLLGATAFGVGCTDGTTDDKTDDTDDTDDTDIDTDDTDETGETGDTDTDVPACYDDGDADANGGTTPFFDLCEYDDDWEMALTVDCGNDNVVVSLRTNNWSYGAELFMVDTRYQFSYNHLVAMTDVGDSPQTNGWTLWEADLTTGVTFGTEDDDSTAAPCEQFEVDGASWATTFAAVVYSDAGTTTVADCIVFGHEADDLNDGDSVIDVNAGGTTTITLPSWLTTANCTSL